MSSTRALPLALVLTRSLPLIRPMGLPIYVARFPSAPLKLVRYPRSLAPTLVTLPSMSLVPFAPLFKRRSNQLCLDLRILSARLPFYFARELNQFADFADLFLEWQLCESLTNFGFHLFGNFKLYRRRMPSSSALSICACDINCSMGAKSL
jgi:hypothetical protein